jgi:hypothetical protein
LGFAYPTLRTSEHLGGSQILLKLPVQPCCADNVEFSSVRLPVCGRVVPAARLFMGLGTEIAVGDLRRSSSGQRPGRNVRRVSRGSLVPALRRPPRPHCNTISSTLTPFNSSIGPLGVVRILQIRSGLTGERGCVMSASRLQGGIFPIISVGSVSSSCPTRMKCRIC